MASVIMAEGMRIGEATRRKMTRIATRDGNIIVTKSTKTRRIVRTSPTQLRTMTARRSATADLTFARENEPREVPRYHRDPVSSREADRDVPAILEQRTVSPGEEGDDRPRKVQLVDPAEKREEYKPKGILKPPRAVPFPEDPNPTREGVAPLKDAHKDGIPPNARWTKISRALVNPEALEKAHERFEERDDYVIVLRVVSREEIQKLAEKTKELRGMYRIHLGETLADY